jgi:ribosomal protein S18 acetylase RimI-like enzyme
MMQVKTKRATIIAVMVLALGALGGIWYYHKGAVEQGQIVDFDAERDTQALLKIFNDNWYWLFPGPDYSPEYILKYHSPGQAPYYAQYFGKLHIKVLRDHDKAAGFTTYYQTNFYEGEIQFIAVDKEFRRKGYGRKLTEYAIRELLKMGVKKVLLTTRLDNAPARHTYEKVGFKEVEHDEDGFIYYAIVPEDFKG